MARVFLLLGSNLGGRVSQLRVAAEALGQRAGRIIGASAYYASAPWGLAAQPDFLNQALLLESTWAADALLTFTKELERRMGRRPIRRWGPRYLDIDLLDYDQQCIQKEDLILPHPQIPHRRFTLVALADLAPDWRHPVLNKTAKALLAACTDTLYVRHYAPPLLPKKA